MATVGLVGLGVATVLSPVEAAGTQRGAVSRPIDGQWNGSWISFAPDSVGFLYEAILTLSSSANNSVEGNIRWRLLRSPRPAEQQKVGMTAVEFVAGSYDPASRVLRLAGVRKDDPNNVIGLDRYHLVLADNGTVLGGITESRETWQGAFSATRVR